MIREILKIGHPMLRDVSKPLPVDLIKSKMVQKLIEELIVTMRDAKGAGLAASQIGELVRMFIVEVEDNPRYPYKPDIPLTVVINPEITFLTDDRFENYEGCLSVPGLLGVVKRCPIIRLTGLNAKGKPIDREIRGISAGTFQHELDHLDGKLFIDRVEDSHTLCTRQAFKQWHESDFRRKIKEIETQYNSEK